MPQVNITLTQDEYDALFKEVTRRMLAGEKPWKMATILHEQVTPYLNSLNGNKPQEDLVPLALQDKTSQENEVSPLDSKQRQVSNDFANLDI